MNTVLLVVHYPSRRVARFVDAEKVLDIAKTASKAGRVIFICPDAARVNPNCWSWSAGRTGPI